MSGGTDTYEPYNTVNGAPTQVTVLPPNQNIIDNPGISDTAYIQPGLGNTIIDILEVTYTPPVIGDILDYTPGNSYAANTYVLADAHELPTNYSEVIGDNNPQWLYRSSTTLAGGQMLEPRDNPNVWTLVTNVYRAPLANLLDSIDPNGLARRGLWNSVAYQAILNIFQTQAMQTLNPEPFGTSWDITNTADTFGDGGFTLRSSVPNRHRVAASTRIITGRTGLINANNSRSNRATLSYLPGTPNITTGQAGFGALGAASLEQLADVNFPDTPTQGDVLSFNEVTNRWENTPGAGRLDLIDITQRDNSDYVDLDVADPNRNIEINDVLELGGSSQVESVVIDGELTAVSGGPNMIFRLEGGGTDGNVIGFLETVFLYQVHINPTTNTDESAFLQVAGRPEDVPIVQSSLWTRRNAVEQLALTINNNLDDLADNNMIVRSDWAVFVESTIDHSQTEIRYVGSNTLTQPIRFRIGTTPSITQPLIDQGFYQFTGGYRLILPTGTTRDANGFAFLPLGTGTAQTVQVDWTITPTEEIRTIARDGSLVTETVQLPPLPTISYNSATTVQASEAATQIGMLADNTWGSLGYDAMVNGTGVELTGPLGQSFILDTVIDSGNAQTDTQRTTNQASSIANFSLQPTFRGLPLAAIDFGTFAPGSQLQINSTQTGFEERTPDILNTENRQLGVLTILDGNEQQIYRGTSSVSLMDGTTNFSTAVDDQRYSEQNQSPNGLPTLALQLNLGLIAADPNNPPSDSYSWVFDNQGTMQTTVLDLTSLADDHPVRRFVALRESGNFALVFFRTQLIGDRTDNFIYLVRIVPGSLVRFQPTVSNFQLEVHRIWDANSGTEAGFFGREGSLFIAPPGEIRLIEPIVAGELFSDDAITALTANEDYILSIDAAGDASWSTAPAAPADWAEANNTDTIPDNKINSNIARDTEVALTVAGDGTVSLNSNAEEGDVRTAIGAGTLSTGTEVITAVNAATTGTIDSGRLDPDLAQSSEVAVNSVTESDGSNTSLLQLSSNGVLSNRPIEARDLPNMTYGDVVTFTNETARNAIPTNPWHQGDIAILTDPDPDLVYLYVGDDQGTTPARTMNDDWHLITPTSGALTMSQVNTFALSTSRSLGNLLINAINANVNANGNSVPTTVTLDDDTITTSVARTSQLPTGTITFTGDVTGSVTPAATDQNNVALTIPNQFTSDDQFIRSIATDSTSVLSVTDGALSATVPVAFAPWKRVYSPIQNTGNVISLGLQNEADSLLVLNNVTETTQFGTFNTNDFTVSTSGGATLFSTSNTTPGLYTVNVVAETSGPGTLFIAGTVGSVDTTVYRVDQTNNQAAGTVSATGYINLSATMTMFAGTGMVDGFVLAWAGTNNDRPRRPVVTVTRIA